MPRRRARRRRAALAAAGLALMCGCSVSAEAEPARSSVLGWGFTHTQFSATGGAPAAVATAAGALRARPLVQNQHMMGWGADNPEPSPGVYDFASLDRRMEFIRESGGVPVITLCCAPDWMKGGTAGATDWSRLEAAPLPEHYADFAALAGQVARRYPDVRHFLVWNEFKGFFDDDAKRWNYEGYTALYNAVREQVKAADPRNQIGGPYLDMAAAPPDADVGPTSLAGPWGSVDPRTLDAFEYWSRHNAGADFVVVDGHATPAGARAADPIVALDKLAAVSAWVRGRQPSLPLWWAEWYVEPPESGWTVERQLAVRTAALMEFARSGVSTVLYWNPDPSSDQGGVSLWTSTSEPTGGQPQPFLAAMQQMARWFPPGQPVEYAQLPDGVRSLSRPGVTLAVNTSDQPRSITVDGVQVALAAYEVRWVERPAE